MPYETPPDLDGLSLAEIAQLAAARKLPPVTSWQPEHSGDSEMRITADGRWFHQGGEIKRPAMIRAFSSLLRRDEDGSHHLFTPQQKLSIIIDDAPFVAAEMTSEGEGTQRQLAFRLNSDDLIIAGQQNVLEVQDRGAGPLLYLHVRDGLWAKLARPVFYELVDLAIAEDEAAPHIWSGGQKFSLAEML